MLGDAPFPLQPDAFSCRDARDFNSRNARMTSNDGPFENPVNAQ
jgi:hypothetical protein